MHHLLEVDLGHHVEAADVTAEQTGPESELLELVL
jgi:hypothetical protein